MKKRIEEFTSRECLNVWMGATGGIVESGMQALLDYIKANLATTEPMSVEEIADYIQENDTENSWGAGALKDFARIIQPITVQQGLVVPDASKWDEDTAYLTVYAYDQRGCYQFYLGTIDRPAPKTRQMTREEKIEKIAENPYFVIGHEDYQRKLKDETLDDLCKAAGIKTEVEA